MDKQLARYHPHEFKGVFKPGDKVQFIPSNIPDFVVSNQEREKKLFDTISSIVGDFDKKIVEIFEQSVRIMATPPIVGKITKTKLRKNKIVLINKGHSMWLEQNGKIISPIIVYVDINPRKIGLNIDSIWRDESSGINYPLAK